MRDFLLTASVKNSVLVRSLCEPWTIDHLVVHLVFKQGYTFHFGNVHYRIDYK